MSGRGRTRLSCVSVMNKISDSQRASYNRPGDAQKDSFPFQQLTEMDAACCLPPPTNSSFGGPGTRLPPKWKSVPNHCFEIPDYCPFPYLVCWCTQITLRFNSHACLVRSSISLDCTTSSTMARGGVRGISLPLVTHAHELMCVSVSCLKVVCWALISSCLFFRSRSSTCRVSLEGWWWTTWSLLSINNCFSEPFSPSLILSSSASLFSA